MTSSPPADGPVVLEYGDRALLVECADIDEVLAWRDAAANAALPAVVDLIPAARTVLVILDGPRDREPTRRRLQALRAGAPAPAPEDGDADVVLDVVYDGADLHDVSDLTGLSTSDIVAAHTDRPWRVGFGGFAPGFAYLVGGDPRLTVPRRDDPRTRVPAGAVGLAGEFSGVYPRQSPGGWQLIGRTSATLWDVERDEPALLRPGMWVRFRAVRS